MKGTNSSGRWWLWRLFYLLAGTLLVICLLDVVLVRAATGGLEPAWSHPSVMALRRVSQVTSAQSEPNLLNNLDCSLVTYRLVGASQMQTGCFTQSAFGLMDSDGYTVIFSGTDEALPLIPNANDEVLAPWPKSSELIALDTVSTGGARIGLYRNPSNAMQDQRNALLQLTAKQLVAGPDLPLLDRLGNPLVINSQTLAFSDSGSWMVAEVLGAGFVRINLATLDMTSFAGPFGYAGTSALSKSRVAVSDDGRYAAVSNGSSSTFKVYDLNTCSGTAVNLQPLNCQSYDYRPFISQQVASLRSIRHVRFVNDGLLSVEASTFDGKGDGIYELAPTANITSLIDYLGMGDSYTSGEGAFDYLAGTDDSNNVCHLSIRSYPVLLTNDLFSSRGGHSVACSGAVINDVGSTSYTYKGQVLGVLDFRHLQEDDPALLNSVMTNFLPGYVAQQRFVGQYQPGVMTVSVGGDDIGFGDILSECVVPHVSRHVSDSTCFDTYEDRQEVIKLVDRTVPRWTALYKQLAAASPGGRVYAIGYPSVADDTGSCAINVQLGKSELEFSEELIDYLNGAIKQAAAKAGVAYVDISKALYGHRLCETASYNVAVNGLTAGTDFGPFGRESYHPNALGQSLIEQAILAQTHNLTDYPSGVDLAPDSQKLLKAPKSGRTVASRVAAKSLVPKKAKAGQTIRLASSGASSGLRPHAVYSVRLDGSAGTVIGSATSNDSSDLDAVVSLPGSVSPGIHTVDVAGENQAGEPTDITQPIYIPVSETDADGDGVPDGSDSCPGAINSGQDADHDGIDDTCDSFIGLPVGPGNSGGGVSLAVTGLTVATTLPSDGSSQSQASQLQPAGQLTKTSSAVKAGEAAHAPQLINPSPRKRLSRTVSSYPSERLNWLRIVIMPLTAWLFFALVALGLFAFLWRSKQATPYENRKIARNV